MEKHKVVERIREYLQEELAALNGGEAERVEEIQSLLVMYRFLPVRDYSGKDEVVCPAALVELEHNSTRAFYFIAPQGGGLVTSIEGRPVQVITPASPMGNALLGRKTGESVQIETRSGPRSYKIITLK